MVYAAVLTTLFLIPLSLALQVPQLAPGSASSDVSASGAVSWDLCAIPEKAVPEESKTPIPRILHQMVFDPAGENLQPAINKSDDLPKRYRRAHDSWLQQAPSWEHHIWTDSDNRALIAAHYPWFLATYDSYDELVQRSDASRFFILHRYGGLYADLDIEALRDPTPLINGGHSLAFFYDYGDASRTWLDPDPWAMWEDNYQGITNAVIAAAPGHPFCMFAAKRLMKSKLDADNYVSHSTGLEKMEKVFWSTGPWFITTAVNDYMKENPEIHGSLYPTKYWLPIPGNQNPAPCDTDVAACREMLPDSILFHHSFADWTKHKRNRLPESKKCH